MTDVTRSDTLDQETRTRWADAHKVIEQAMAFQPAKLVLTALDLGLFTLLAEGSATEEQIRERLSLHRRGTRDFLDALTELGLLEWQDGKFRNGLAAGRFLVRGGDAYLGGFLGMADGVMYPAWGRLVDLLRTGKPQAATFQSEDMFGELYSSQEEKARFISMAEDASRPLIPALVRSFDWSSYKSVLELGGCRGNVLANLVRACPHLAGTVFDLPPLRTAFDDHMATLGMTGKVAFHAGDFFTDPLPEADVLMIGHSLVDWDDDQRQELITRTYPAIRPDGAFLVWDPMIVDGAESYLRNLICSLNLQLMTPRGGGYRIQECEEWMRAAGYTDVSHRSLGHDVTLVVARPGPPVSH